MSCRVSQIESGYVAGNQFNDNIAVGKDANGFGFSAIAVDNNHITNMMIPHELGYFCHVTVFFSDNDFSVAEFPNCHD
jgi:nitrogen fixation protein FixH